MILFFLRTVVFGLTLGPWAIQSLTLWRLSNVMYGFRGGIELNKVLLFYQASHHHCPSIPCRQNTITDQRVDAFIGVYLSFITINITENLPMPEMLKYRHESFVGTSSMFPRSVSCVGIVFGNGDLLSDCGSSDAQSN